MSIKKTQAEFDVEVKEVEKHGLYLDPSAQQYQGTHYKYTWKCANNHSWNAPFIRIKQGHGCPICSIKHTSTKNTISVEQFLLRLDKRNLVYPKVEYVSGFNGMTKKSIFRCVECNHEWKTLPKTIIQGSGCPECKRINNIHLHLYTHDEFIEKLNIRNSGCLDSMIYLDSGQTYEGSGSKLVFVCENNHRWKARPGDILNKNIGCPHCAGIVRRGFRQALLDIKEKWPQLTVCSQHGDQLGRRESVEVQCENNHIWDTTYERLMNGHYCPHCYGNARYNQQTFIQKLLTVAPTIQVLGQYQQTHIPIDVKCNVCQHRWKPRPYNLIQGYGCPQCSRNNKFSKKSLVWLKYIELRDNCKLNHATQYGEFRVPGTRYRVDGFNPKTNTIYEFYGDYWHGNPKVYDPTQYNQHLNKSYNDLYQHTILREQKLINLGYNVVSVWESDFDQLITNNFTAEVLQYINVSDYTLVQQTSNIIELESEKIVLIIININVPPAIDERKSTIKQSQRHHKPVFVLFSDELKQRPDLIRRKLSHYTQNNNVIPRIHARDCKIVPITNKEKSPLLDKNHVQGNDNSQIAYGAYYNDELVAVMTFSVPRTGIGVHKNKQTNTFELVRFCTEVSYRIPGIASRLLEHFKRNHEWTEIYSYADKRWSKGNMYYQLGFNLVVDNPPDYFYIVNGVRKHRWNYRKDMLKNSLINYDPSLTEYQNMTNHGFYRVWDCGTLKFSIKNPKL